MAESGIAGVAGAVGYFNERKMMKIEFSDEEVKKIVVAHVESIMAFKTPFYVKVDRYSYVSGIELSVSDKPEEKADAS